MNIKPMTIAQSLNKAYLKQDISITDYNRFIQALRRFFQSFDNKAIENIVKSLFDFFETDIKNVIDQDSYSIDIALVKNIPYFIEVNCFGKEYAAGSSLFHWIIDYDLLYSDGKTIYFRYTY